MCQCVSFSVPNTKPKCHQGATGQLAAKQWSGQAGTGPRVAQQALGARPAGAVASLGQGSVENGVWVQSSSLV